MIHDEDSIQVASLCPIQFREPKELDLYPDQYDYFIPKIWNSMVRIQVYFSQYVAINDMPLLLLKNESGRVFAEKTFTVSETSTGSGIYTGNVSLTKEEIELIPSETIAYFEITNSDKTEVYADSLWYEINPYYTKNLKTLSYSHSENDYGIQFNGNKFTLTVECGYTPQDSRTEQDSEDFMQQNMVNEVVYGDTYEVLGLTVGTDLGIPNWLRHKIDMASLLDTFEVNGEAVTRVQGSKMEQVEPSKHGLGIYKLDVQTLKNYMQ